MLCKICQQDKPLADFYVGVGARCKECHKAAVRKRRAEHIDAVREYDRRRGMLPHRVEARKQYQQTERGREAFKRSNRAYYARDPDRHMERVAQWRAEHAERYHAHIALNNAVRDGRIVPWPVCAVPDCTRRPEAHHPDYSRPFDVVWLCKLHHEQAHALVEAA